MNSPCMVATFRQRIWLWMLLSVAVVVALTFLLPGDLFLSSPDADLIAQLAAWRAFAADSIRAGHFPLWNPYTYSGQPFLGDFQSAELYPPNIIFLFLPLVRAINLSFLLHLLLVGWGMGFWVTRRGGHPLAGALAGIALALSGPVFLRLFAGHIAYASTIGWAPWLFCALEAAWQGPRIRPLLLAAAVVCLQILGGGPQYVFYLAIAASIHAVIYSIANPSVRWRALPNLIPVYLFGAALAAAQLLPSLAAVGESVRQDKLAYNFVSMFSFPPENVLTLIAPGVFGNLTNATYWGRCYLWEVSIFISVSGLVMVGLACCDSIYRRRTWLDLLIAAFLGLLALGDHTPLLHFLYDHVFGFDKFRAVAKFVMPMLLFVALGIGAGADALIRGRLGKKNLAVCVILIGVVTFLAGIFVFARPVSLANFTDFIQRTNEGNVSAAQFADAQFMHNISAQAVSSLAWSSLILITIGIALLLARRWTIWRWVPIILLPVEMLCFVHANLGTAHVSDLVPTAISSYLAAHPGDYRILSPLKEDNGFFTGKSDMWGNDPTPLKRYTDFIAFTQGANPDHSSQYTFFQYLPKTFSLLRFRLAFIRTDHGYQIIDNPGALPHALLVSNYQVKPTRDAIFAQLKDPAFNPSKTILLESEPVPCPQPDAPSGAVQLLELNADTLEITADTPAPVLLLITDLYCSGWQARPLPDSAQSSYQILPADYVIRAIPLAAGHHHLIVEYAPSSFRNGLVLSSIACLVWTGLFAFTLRKQNAAQSLIVP